MRAGRAARSPVAVQTAAMPTEMLFLKPVIRSLSMIPIACWQVWTSLVFPFGDRDGGTSTPSVYPMEFAAWNAERHRSPKEVAALSTKSWVCRRKQRKTSSGG